MPFIDSHCHLDMLAAWEDENCDEAAVMLEVAAALKRAAEQGVGIVLNPGVDWQTMPLVLEVAKRFPQVVASVGIHPHEADSWQDGTERLRGFAMQPKVVAIGEIGLDYYYPHGSRPAQHQAFREQIRLARALQLPTIIHTRDAEEDTLRILREESHFLGVLHCYTGSWNLAQAALELGFYVSFSGAVTFKKSEALREVARQVPLDRILIETDSPYLAPPPHRGKRNEPAYVLRIAEQLAEIHGCSLEEIGRITTTNASRLFNLPIE